MEAVFHPDYEVPEEAEVKLTGRASDYVRRLWPFFRPHLKLIAAAGAMLVVSTVLGLAGPVLMKRAIDMNIARGDLRGLGFTTLVWILAQLGVVGATYLQNVWLAIAGERGAAGLKQRLFEHALSLPMRFFDTNPVGRLVSRVESDTEALKMLFAGTSVVLLQSALAIIGMSVVMVIASWRLYLLVLVLLPPFVLAFRAFQRRVRPLYHDIRRNVADLNSLVSESLKGLPVIQVFGQEGWFARRMDNLNRVKFGNEMRVMTLWYAVWVLVDFGEVIGIALVLGFGSVWAVKGMLTIGTLFLFVAYVTRLFAPLRQISDQINVMQRAFASAERVFRMMDEEPEPDGGPSAGRLRFQREIALAGLGFSYDGESRVLNNVNLVIRRGEKVALVGETGGGKTTIVSLLLRFYTAQTGTVLVDGRPLAGLNKHDLRSVIGFVPQDVMLFPGTVLDNLRMLDESVPAERVMAAARRVRVHDAIMRFPEGYATNLIERGANFSLGERQLLAFARALVFDPDILILDEATSSIDPQTEQLIQQGLEELLKGRTAIIVAHRLATIRMVDRVVVVHKGRIAEEGTHEELLARAGIYSRLYRLQYVAGNG